MEACKKHGRAPNVRAGILSALALVCAYSLGCSSGVDSKQQKAQAAAPHAVSVAVAPVLRQDVPIYLTGLGAVTAFNTANIKSRIDGQIMRVNFQEGQDVREGELLIEIDSRPYEVMVEQMEAQLFKDQASLRDAKLNLDRYTALIPSGSIAQQQVDTQKSMVDQLEGQVRTDQAQIDSAKLNIIYSRITAPFTGRVGLRQVDPGNIVHAADTNPMLILTQLQPIAVIFTLPEDVLPSVSTQMKHGTLEVDALPVSALPEVDYPDDQVLTFYPGRQPGCDGLVGHRAAGAAVRPGARPEPDDLDQLGGKLGHHAAVRWI
jgi:multidrug efflux system membrane fusion protein